MPRDADIRRMLLCRESADEVLISSMSAIPRYAMTTCRVLPSQFSWLNGCQATAAATTIRFLFIPGTIGSIAWLSKNEARIETIKHGVVVT